MRGERVSYEGEGGLEAHKTHLDALSLSLARLAQRLLVGSSLLDGSSQLLLVVLGLGLVKERVSTDLDDDEGKEQDSARANGAECVVHSTRDFARECDEHLRRASHL